jgi:hypothetical protein
MSIEDVARLLDEGGQSLRFSRTLLAATFENLHSGISVIDADLNLVAWNTQYIELFNYPPGLVRVGVPIADLIRFNVERGHFAGTPDEEVEKRLASARARGRSRRSACGPTGASSVHRWTDAGRRLCHRLCRYHRGSPRAGELRRTLEQLESRVAERTRELSEANRLLADRRGKDALPCRGQPRSAAAAACRAAVRFRSRSQRGRRRENHGRAGGAIDRGGGRPAARAARYQQARCWRHPAQSRGDSRWRACCATSPKAFARWRRKRNCG